MSLRWLVLTLVGVAASCTVQKDQPNLVGQDVRVTVIHTADIHSRLFPYDFVPLRIDQDYGLLPGQGPYGGIARIGAIVKNIRAGAKRSIWLDSGDCFEGAPVFNVYRGEVEMRALSLLGLDGEVIGNHEFDLGADNLYDQIVANTTYPMLAANYLFDDPATPNRPKLKEVVKPYQIYDVDGITIGVIGMANWSSLTSIYEGGNSLGLRPLDDAEVVRQYVALLRPQVDLVVLLSHLGLDEDEGLGASDVQDQNLGLPLDGVDLVLGGHLHIVLNPPKVINVDAAGNQTVLVHSGAFAKYVGKLDLVVHKGTDNGDPTKRSHIVAFSYDNLPVECGVRATAADACPNPEDPETLAMLQPYSVYLNQLFDLKGVFAYVDTGGNKIVRNDPSGGDSQLGNLVARAMQRRQGVDADFALTNSLGIRADFEDGPLDLEQMFNVFPFENSITIMYLSGSEVHETLDFVARKSSERGCRAQAQVAGITFTMVCGSNPHAEDIYLGEHCRKDDGTIDPMSGCVPLLEGGLYRVAVNDYIAAGGSGFDVLKRNTSKFNTGISLRDSLQTYIRALTPCDPSVIDSSDPQARPVVDVYGPITCLDATIEAHDDRIFPKFE
jgi:2',3'-cyclic-nucleotide 2'-phosphodiesterase (5'-nucleotidase family)